jgi:hypothetical protein
MLYFEFFVFFADLFNITFLIHSYNIKIFFMQFIIEIVLDDLSF